MTLVLESRIPLFTDSPATLHTEYFNATHINHVKRLQNDWKKIQKKHGKVPNGRNLLQILALIAHETVDFTKPEHRKTVYQLIEKYADKFQSLTSGAIEFDEAKIVSDHYTGSYQEQKEKQTKAAFFKLKTLLSPEYSAEFLTHCPNAAKKLPRKVLHNIIKDNISAPTSIEISAKQWGTISNLISYIPGYAGVLDETHIEMMFAATAGDTAKFTQLFDYLLSHKETLATLIRSKLFENAADTTYQPTTNQEKAITAIRHFFYQEIHFQLQEKYFSTAAISELVRQVYLKRSSDFSTLIQVIHNPCRFLIKQDWLRPQATPNSFLVYLLPAIHKKLTAKDFKTFLLNGTKALGNRFIDTLYAFANHVQADANHPEIYRNILLTTLSASLEVKDHANISASQLDTWIKKSNYDPAVCRFIATHNELRKRIMSVADDQFNNEAYLNAACRFQRVINKDGLKAALRTFILIPSQPEPALCALIANRKDYWEQLLTMALSQKKSWFSKITPQEIANVKEALGNKSLFFKARLSGMPFADFLASNKISAEDKTEYAKLSANQGNQPTNIYRLEAQFCERPRIASNPQTLQSISHTGSNVSKKLAEIQHITSSKSSEATISKLTIVAETPSPTSPLFRAKKGNTPRIMLPLDENAIAATPVLLSPRCA